MFRIRVCPRRSPFLMLIRLRLTSAALARDCGRRFKVCLLHFSCVIASYDRWCRVVPLLAVARPPSVCFCPQTSRCLRRVARLTSAALARDCGHRFKVRLLPKFLDIGKSFYCVVRHSMRMPSWALKYSASSLSCSASSRSTAASIGAAAAP